MTPASARRCLPPLGYHRADAGPPCGFRATRPSSVEEERTKAPRPAAQPRSLVTSGCGGLAEENTRQSDDSKCYVPVTVSFHEAEDRVFPSGSRPAHGGVARGPADPE